MTVKEPIEEEEEEEEEQEQEEEEPKTKPSSDRRRRPKQVVFNVETDDVCMAIRAFFEQQQTPTAISRNVTILAEDDSEIQVGKMLHSLRLRFRAKHTPLTKARLEALQDLEELQKFLKKTPISKQRSNASSSTQLVSMMRSKLHETQEYTLRAEWELANCNVDIAKQEMDIFEARKKKQKCI